MNKTEEAKRKKNPQQPRHFGIKQAPRPPAPPRGRSALAGGRRPVENPPQGPEISTGRGAPPANNKPVSPPLTTTTTTTTAAAADPKSQSSYSAFRPGRLKIGQPLGFGTAAASKPEHSALRPARLKLTQPLAPGTAAVGSQL